MLGAKARFHSVWPFRKLVCLAVFAIAPSASGPANALEALNVIIDQAKIVKMPDGAVTLIVGNPAIADVTLLKGNATMVVTGKGYGETNLVALNRGGDLVAETMIRVKGANSALIVMRGLARESYSCTPTCQPIAELGDSRATFDEVQSQTQARNAMASGNATAGAGAAQR